MKAKVTEDFPGCEDGNPATRTIKEDEVITGELAAVAVANGWADEVEDDATVVSIEIPKDIAKLTNDELRAIADKENIDIDGKDKKAVLLRKIAIARAARA